MSLTFRCFRLAGQYKERSRKKHQQRNLTSQACKSCVNEGQTDIVHMRELRPGKEVCVGGGGGGGVIFTSIQLNPTAPRPIPIIWHPPAQKKMID